MSTKHVDVLLVGAGAMSSTLGVLLKQLDPSLTIAMVERLDHIAQESTSGWNNAGTGHAAYCELNYTPETAEGKINASKAFDINASFEVSTQFWAYLVEQGALPEPQSFINPTPHVSFVWGENNVNYLRKRFEALSNSAQFAGMEYSEDPEVLKQWMPLVMEGRNPNEKVAGTRVSWGTDVNFGALARHMIEYSQRAGNFDLYLGHEVSAIKRQGIDWLVTAKDKHSTTPLELSARFVFLGAGGAALLLLQKSGVDESLGYGGFPVSGQWLVCKNPDIVKQHLAKVYGKAAIGAPPMSVPHLDTRIIDGEHALLFGPFAGFTTKFLKLGSFFDLFASLRPSNLIPMLKVGLTSFDLIKYLITEVLQTRKSRMVALREYYPQAQDHDWSLAFAGQRVQIIKKDPKTGGKLEFGTEVVAAKDGSLAALLGASPGASVAVTAMLQVIEKCFADQLKTSAWQTRIKTMIPSYGQSLTEDAELLKQVRQHSLTTLKIIPPTA
ncbi:MAG: malate dehydrogenase (quinone) [Thiofilum sp.]|uniref:malate dehydrogenase (quinone) n=2 Tax=Thiofilum sp. TaxID=2212733 RepID=UPI0025E98F78|nr:malate dehydrogenase (quinone) [Thiofilum sp.]MBK8451831.1 malate dehydrogenase (quinone) [Thiofilum sp.]